MTYKAIIAVLMLGVSPAIADEPGNYPDATCTVQSTTNDSFAFLRDDSNRVFALFYNGASPTVTSDSDTDARKEVVLNGYMHKNLLRGFFTDQYAEPDVPLYDECIRKIQTDSVPLENAVMKVRVVDPRPATESADGVSVTGSYIRETPNGKKVGLVSAGTDLEITDCSDKTWMKVVVKGSIGKKSCR